jgi:hypothetical protein
MAPSKIEDLYQPSPKVSAGFPRNIASIDALKFDANLQPKNYEIAGTNPESKILFLDVNILDSTGREPYLGDVLIEGIFHIA